MYNPPEKDNFCFLLQTMVVPLDSEGEESFDIEVFTPMWLCNILNKYYPNLWCYANVIKNIIIC